MPIEPTEKDVMLRDGSARLLRFRGSEAGTPLLLVPSLINRWYVLDLRPGASLVEALTKAGIDTWCLDWGVPEDEDRYLSWEDVLARLDRAARFVQRTTKSAKLSVLGYCMGATLSAVWAALHANRVASFINLTGPIDFSRAGQLATLTDRAWFDVGALTDAGNLAPLQIQSGFTALRPTQGLAKVVGYLDRAHDETARAAFDALEGWASDNVPFPAAAYRTYVEELYQRNSLFNGTHRVAGRPANLAAIDAPTMVIGAERDAICPVDAASALLDRVSSSKKELLVVPGGHVGAVIGSRAAKVLYPAITKFVAAESPQWN
jgi:polyhydroxyalkanoate synthase